jgi:hypothetical protein
MPAWRRIEHCNEFFDDAAAIAVTHLENKMAQ